MLARVTTFAIHGVESRRITVEVDIRSGLPAFTIVGLGDRAVRESRERVRVAIGNSGFKFPDSRVTVNLAPAYLRKEGPGFDLAIAVGILVAAQHIPAEPVTRMAVFGELGLEGDLRPARGTLAVAEGGARHGFEGLVVVGASAAEALLVDGLEVYSAQTLLDVVSVLRGEAAPATRRSASAPAPNTASGAPDLADVRGHHEPVAALEIAAAGGHNLLFAGPPGTGKTMLAKRLPSILPALTPAEAIEVTRIHSVAGRHPSGELITARPYRAPHHSISASGLVGGGSVPTPGEATLAHHGVLFLDELAEFARPALEALRQPLEDGRVAIVRGQRVAVYPTRVMLVASTNPCPCGYLGSRRCRCTEGDVARYRRRLSGPLLDRIDLQVEVPRPSPAELATRPPHVSEQIRARVVGARDRQLARLSDTGVTCNAHMDTALLRRHVRLDPQGEGDLQRAYARGALSPRGHSRVLRVARTIADLEASEDVAREHVLQALAFRHDADRVSGEDAA